MAVVVQDPCRSSVQVIPWFQYGEESSYEDFEMGSTTMNGYHPPSAVHSHSCRASEANLYASQEQGQLLGPWACSFQCILTVEFQCFAQNLS